jgi:hypothetical protein
MKCYTKKKLALVIGNRWWSSSIMPKASNPVRVPWRYSSGPGFDSSWEWILDWGRFSRPSEKVFFLFGMLWDSLNPFRSSFIFHRHIRTAEAWKTVDVSLVMEHQLEQEAYYSVHMGILYTLCLFMLLVYELLYLFTLVGPISRNLIKPCIDVCVSISIYVCWSENGMELSLIPLQSTSVSPLEIISQISQPASNVSLSQKTSQQYFQPARSVQVNRLWIEMNTCASNQSLNIWMHRLR